MNFNMPPLDIKTVSEINREIQILLDNQYRFVRVIGEVSNLRRPLSGHCYFNLKDQGSQIKAVLFKNQQRYLASDLRDGQQVVCDGRIGVYEPRGEYQIIVDTVDFQGRGQLQIAFEQLKQKLKGRGFFDAQRKKRLPEPINTIVLITSPTGAAVHDFLAICKRRAMDVHVQILPVPVQGEDSAALISAAIGRAQELDPDVIVLCRGGGSIEDLWSFNDEGLAQAITDSNIPIVTGIGHETDFTIADFCADVRGETPTGAAELLVPDQMQFRRRLADLRGRIGRAMYWQIDSVEHQLKRSATALASLDGAFRQQATTLEATYTRLTSCISQRLDHSTLDLANLEVSLMRTAPLHHIEIQQNRVNEFHNTLCHSMERLVEEKQNLLGKNAAVLDSLSPLATLGRGYALVMSKHTKTGSPLIRSTTQLRVHDQLVIKLHEGEADCSVIDIRDDAPGRVEGKQE